MSKGVGYCENTDCLDFHKGVFLLNFSDQFYCPVCRSTGQLVAEQRDEVDIRAVLYTMVIVNFDYTPAEKRYKARAIVQIEPRRDGSIYNYSSPLIKTEIRALKIGESLLVALNSGATTNDLLTCETVLSFDQGADEFKASLKRLEYRLDERERRLNEY